MKIRRQFSFLAVPLKSIFTIGISLYPTAVHYMAGGDAAGEWFGGVRSWGVALFTFAVVVLFSNFARGIWR